MASTYSNLKIQLMTTGENTTTWGDVTNVNLGTAIEEAIVGSADVTFSSGNVTLSLSDTNSTQAARNIRLRCTGTTGGSTRNLVVPSIEKPYIVKNDCADSILVKTTAGTGITVPAGKTMWVYSDGTDVVDVITRLSSVTLGTALAVADGGTGVNGTPTNGQLLIGNGTGFTLATITQGANIEITNSAGGITIASAVAYPTAGIAVSTGSAWNTSLTAPSGDVVGTSDTQTLSNKTLNANNSVSDTGTVAATSPGFRGLPQNSKTANYTLALTDAGKSIPNTTGGWAIPANSSVAFPVGTTIVLYNNSASSQNITITTDTLRLAGTTSTGTRALAARGLATLVKVASTEWVASGAGVS